MGGWAVAQWLLEVMDDNDLVRVVAVEMERSR